MPLMSHSTQFKTLVLSITLLFELITLSVASDHCDFDLIERQLEVLEDVETYRAAGSHLVQVETRSKNAALTKDFESVLSQAGSAEVEIVVKNSQNKKAVEFVTKDSIYKAERSVENGTTHYKLIEKEPRWKQAEKLGSELPPSSSKPILASSINRLEEIKPDQIYQTVRASTSATDLATKFESKVVTEIKKLSTQIQGKFLAALRNGEVSSGVGQAGIKRLKGIENARELKIMADQRIVGCLSEGIIIWALVTNHAGIEKLPPGFCKQRFP